MRTCKCGLIDLDLWERFGPPDFIHAPESCHSTNLLEWAWGIIANAHGGDWTKATSEWREAANLWRDSYFKAQEAKP
jgi:hypothetical protein